VENIFELKGKDPYGGLYIHLFQPKKDISEPGKNIKKGMSVIKPGSFKNSLSSRMKSYYSPKYWHYTNTNIAAFKNEVTKSYLIFDATKLDESDRWLINGLEVKLIELVEKYFNVISKIGRGKSEYREIEFTTYSDFTKTIKKISKEIHQILSINLNYDYL
jgi:hypothetical protein